MCEGWENVELQDIATIRAGGKLRLTGKHFVPEGFPAYGAGGINGFLKEKEFSQTGLVLSSIGARCGKCFYAEGEWVSLANTQLIFPDTNTILPRFLWYQLDDEDSWPRAGSTQPFIRSRDIKSRVVQLPTLREQRRIVDLIEAVDDAVEAAREGESRASEALQQLIKTFTAESSTPLGKLASMRSGPSWKAADETTEPREGAVPVLAITNTKASGEIDLSEQRYVSGLVESVMRLSANSIVMIRTNGNRSRIGNVYRANEQTLGCAVSAFQIAIEPNDGGNADFLYWMLSASDRQKMISDAASGSTGLGNIAIGWLKQMPVPMPKNNNERDEFVALCSAASDTRSALSSYADSLRSLRSNLITAVLSGAHEIPSTYDEVMTTAA